MVFRSLFLVLLLFSSLVAQDANRPDPPYSKPPELKHLFTDSFAEDSRDNYKISGKTAAVTWKQGELALGDGANLQRKLDAGSWVEMEFDFEFPQLKKDGEEFDLKIWLDLYKSTDSFVWFKQKKEKGKYRSAVFVVNTNGMWNAYLSRELVSQPWTLDDPLPNGRWKIVFRYGNWSVLGPGMTRPLMGAIDNNETRVSRIVLTTSKQTARLRGIRVSQAERVKLDRSAGLSKKIRDSYDWDEDFVNLYGARKYAEAIPIAERTTRFRKTFLGKYHTDYTLGLSNLAVGYWAAKRQKEAEPLYLEAKQLIEQVQGKNHPDYTSCLDSLATMYQSMKEYDKAEAFFLELGKCYKETRGVQHDDFVANLNKLANLYKLMRAFDKAEKQLLQVKDILEQRGESQNLEYVKCLEGLANLDRLMAKFQHAESYLTEASNLRKKLSGPLSLEYASSLNRLAVLYADKGAVNETIRLSSEAASIQEKIVGRKHRDFASSLNNLASAYQLLGAYPEAEARYLEVLEIQRELVGDQHQNYARYLNNLANLYQLMGAYEKAEPLQVQALAIRKKKYGTQHPFYASSLNDLAGVYDYLGDLEKAEKLYREALEIQEKVFGKNHPDYALSLNNLGALFESLGKFEEAEAYHRIAKEIRKKTLGELHPDYAQSLNNLANVCGSLKKYEEAEKHLVEASSIWNKIFGEDHALNATALHNLANLHSSTGNIEKAIPLFLKADEIFTKTVGVRHPRYADNLRDLAILYQRNNSPKEAERLLRQSLLTSRENIDRYFVVQGERQRQQYAKSFDVVLSHYFSNALRLQSQVDRTWELASKWKGISLIRQKRNRILGSLPETQSIFEELKQVKTQISNHVQSSPSIKGWKERLDVLATKEEKLEKKLARKLVDLKFFSPDAGQTIELPQGVCLVDFRRFDFSQMDAERRLRYEPHYLAMVVRPGFPVEILDLGSAETIENAINVWRGQLKLDGGSSQSIDSPSRSSFTQAGVKLRKLLWDPLETTLGDQDLVIISPTVLLGRLPLVALPGKKPGSYLLEETKIACFPVPALLPALLKAPGVPIDGGAQALLVGQIDYGVFSNGRAAELPASRNRTILENLSFAPLPGTGLEINGIKKLFYRSTVLSGKDATERAVKTQLRDHSILHIATHGFFQAPERFLERMSTRKTDQQSSILARQKVKVLTENPDLLSGLAFANANLAVNKSFDEAREDGIMYSAEIAMMPLENMELAVLSACETSLGTDDNPGEGLIGIQRAFQVAGAKSVVASYWKVNDQATQLLMNKFYENLLEYSAKADPEKLKNNRTTIRIDALRDAQLWMLNNPIVASTTSRGEPIEVDPKKIKKAEASVEPGNKNQRTHPRYWAAFMLSGDWR